MMFNKFAVLALLAVTLLAVSAIGHPTAETAAEETTGSTVKPGIHGWLKKVQAKIVKSHDNCTHGGGVIHWVKNKLGLVKPTTTTETPTTTAETDYSGYIPVTSTVNVPQGETEEGYGGDDITILDDTAAVIPENVNSNESASVDTTSSITENTSYPEDPSIDVRMQ
ncbi:uncharacterized protein LOC112597469 [Melanaphis sacchari]|uniref:uncharacterized protein LOC112597469 n=1 Tax=Melanaphis sacchari TaxID=742174 RepID=UPI000DC14C63|nr:uncharacterized protein LOC112597469 [Melanaphis sacchari]